MDDTPVPVITDNDRVFVSQQYLTIVTAIGTDSGKYYCVLSSSDGTAKSNDVFLNVWSELCYSTKHCKGKCKIHTINWG